jgi:hypothetical protein
MTRVTLDIDEHVLARAKERAAAQNTTVEAMLESFVQVLAQPQTRREDLPPITRSALGLLKGLPDRPDKELLEDALEDKYGPLK